MHIHKRAMIVVSCLALLAPASGLLTARLDMTARDQAQSTLHEAIATAADEYRSGMGTQLQGDRAKDEMRAAARRLSHLRQHELAVRQRLIHLRAAEGTLRARAGSGEVLTASGVTLRSQKIAMLGLIGRLAGASSMTVFDALRQTLTTGDSIGTALLPAVVRTLTGVYDLRYQHEMLTRSLTDATAERTALLADIRATDDRYQAAARTYAMSASALDDIQATVREVHGQVLLLQAQLSDIDEKLQRHAARELIAKGLLEPGELPSRVHASAPAFVWPANGRITAGFHEPSYSDHFGIPHEAIDIAAEQGTPVLAAADGIVFLARDGGATGYSYVLIGHQDGFATLYGHLSNFAVSAGDVVAAGEVIGQSGGTPGTHGAGPMTTGPHLHFEVIQNGLHIDPRLILP